MIRQINVITGVETQREMTAEEQSVADANSARELAEKPMREWKFKIAETDSGMLRSLEDLITDKFAGDAGTSLQERYDAKIKIRGERP
jgi:hypothetical protein